MADEVELLQHAPPSRWVVLAACCFIMTGVYYSLDTPSALHSQLQTAIIPQHTFEFDFNLLYTLYSAPNVILPFVGGYFVDQLGSSVCLMLFASFCGLGQFVFAAGLAARHWPSMWFGRFLYGLGGESICVAYSTLLSEWFMGGNDIALAFGIALAVSRLGSVLNNMISPVVANRVSVDAALWLAALFNGLSFGTALWLWYFERTWRQGERAGSVSMASEPQGSLLEEPLLTVSSREHALEQDQTPQDDFEDLPTHFLEEEEEEGEETYSSPSPLAVPRSSLFNSIRKFGAVFWCLAFSCFTVYACILPWNNVASGILLERNFMLPPPTNCHLPFPMECTEGTLARQNNHAVDDKSHRCPVPSHHAPLLPSSLNVTLPDGSVYSKDSIQPDMIDCSKSFWSRDCTADYCRIFKRGSEAATRYMSIPYTMSACLSPFLGRLIDTIGQRAYITALASVLLIAVHTTLALSRLPPALPLLGQGLAYSFYASVLWPSITLVVPTDLTGQAFGIITSIQNIGLAIVPMMVAAVYKKSSQRYIPHVELFFALCACVGSAVGVVLIVLDRSSGNRLNRNKASSGRNGVEGELDEVLAANAVGHRESVDATSG